MIKQEPNPQIKAHVKDFALLFSVPLGAIVLILAFLYIPRFFAHPSYDFIYCSGYYCESSYTVDPSGKLHVSDSMNDSRLSRNALLRYYDAARDTTRPLSSEEVSRYKLDSSSKSPDGYSLSKSGSNGGFLFWGSNYGDDWSLRKGIVARPIDLDTHGNDIHLIAWVLRNDE